MNITRPEQFSTLLKEYRMKQGYTQADIASLVGIRIATISNFENNPETCKLATVFKILAALNLTLDVTTRSKEDDHKKAQWDEEW